MTDSTMIIDNLIIIKGGAYNEVKKALCQWMNLYSNDLPKDIHFRLYKNGHDSHLLQADEQLDNERFYYLVNYLNYPEGIHYNVDIVGFTTGKIDDKFKNKKLLVYISPNEKDFDNVFVTTSENENFKIDFGGKITETSGNKIYRLPNDLTFNNPEIITNKTKQNIKETTELKNDKLARRFILLSAIVVSAYALTFLILNTGEYFTISNFILSFSVFGWLLHDYKILQIDRLYFGSLVLSLVIFLYGYFLEHCFLLNDKSVLDIMGTSIPAIFLFLQRPLRLGFKAIMKREPIVDKPAPSFADFIYIFSLSMATIFIGLFCEKK